MKIKILVSLLLVFVLTLCLASCNRNNTNNNGNNGNNDNNGDCIHFFGEWQDLTLPTFDTEGSHERVCNLCGRTENEATEKIPFRATYSKEGEYDVVVIDRSTPGYASDFSVKKGWSSFEIVGEYVDPAEIEIVYFGDNVIEVGFGGGSLREVHFSDAIEYIGSKAFWINEQLKKVYFEGDAPEIDSQAFNLNGSGKIDVYPSENSKGFDGFIFGGCEIIRSWLIKDKFDPSSVTLSEYARLVAEYTDELVNDIIKLYENKGQEAFLCIPFESDMERFRKIKDFTLELTKNCNTEREKIDTIYDWIAANVEYSDPASYYTSYEVMESKKAVCAGYTTLMHDMLAAIDIPALYVRGSTLFGSLMTVSDVFSRPDDFPTHAWVAVYTSDGKVSYYDPTWGVSSPEQYKNMTAAQVGEYAVAYEIDSKQVMIDGVDHHDFLMNDGIQFIYDDGYIYSSFFGQIGGNAITEYYNYWFSFAHTTVTGDHYISKTEQPIGSIYNDGFIAMQGLGNIYFCLADGRTVEIEKIAEYLYMQSKVYGKEITYSWDRLVYEDGFIFFICDDNTARVVVYIGDEQEVTIPSSIKGHKVVRISQQAFKNNDTVRRIIISEGITTFYEGSFEGCSNLEYIYIPSTYEWSNGEIETHALFMRCYNLKTIEISKDHPHFTSVDGNLYTKDMTCLVAYAPANDYTVFTLPKSVTEIYRHAFAYSKIESVILHDGVTKIWPEAFWHSNIEYISIPAGCELGSYTFHYATSLKTVVFDEGITEIPYSAFNNCQSLKNVILPSTVKTIGDFAFTGCYSLITVNLPEGLEAIGHASFLDSALVSINLPKSLKSIGSSAFDSCYALYVVNNQSSLEIIQGDRDSNGGVGYYARRINSENGSYSITLTDNGLVFYEDEDVVILVEFLGCEGDTLVLPESFNGRSYYIVERAFAAFDYIGYVQQGNDIVTWEDYAFHYGQAIKTLVIPETIEFIPDYTFEGWSNIENIYYGGSSESWENLFSRLPNFQDPLCIPMNDELMNATVHFEK